jgi:hypothetical protein
MGLVMKHWDEALRRARSTLTETWDSATRARWLAEFILEQHDAAVLDAELSDPVQTARQLTIVQARCTELLEEVRHLKKTARSAMVGLRSEIQHYCSCTPTGRNEACLLHGDPIDEKIDAGHEKARLDPDGTLKGKTALTAPVVGENGGVPFAGPASTHVNLESGRRTDLAPSYERVLSNWYNNPPSIRSCARRYGGSSRRRICAGRSKASVGRLRSMCGSRRTHVSCARTKRTASSKKSPTARHDALALRPYAWRQRAPDQAPAPIDLTGPMFYVRLAS